MYFTDVAQLKNPGKNRLNTILLIFIFTVMAGFSPVLHNHDYELEDSHQDCSPCQFSQISAELNDFSPDLFSIPIIQIYRTKFTLDYVVKFFWKFSGLSPPL